MVLELVRDGSDSLASVVLPDRRCQIVEGEADPFPRTRNAKIEDAVGFGPDPVQPPGLDQLCRHFGLVNELPVRLFDAAIHRASEAVTQRGGFAPTPVAASVTLG